MVIASHVHKSFSEKQVLQDISFHIKSGEKVGFIGLNGAGKTALMQLLAGILRADSGYIRIAGEKPCSRRKCKKVRIGVVSTHQSNLHSDRPVEASINLCRKMYPNAWNQETIHYINEHLKINELRNRTKSSLSMGERMRAEFFCAAISAPHLLIMDEPTNGMDYTMRTKEYECLEYLNRQQGVMPMAVLLVTHSIQELELLCERVIAIHGGQIIFDGAMEHLQRKYISLGRIHFDLEEGALHFHDMPIKKYEIDGKRVHITFDKHYVSANIILHQLMEKAVIKNIKILDIDIETIIRSLYQENERGGSVE